MIQIAKPFIFILLSSFCITIVRGQTTIPSAGGNGVGGGGSISYTVGQITFTTISGSNGTVAQGIQQPYEISVVTAIENSEQITLDYKIYPNPATSMVTVIIRPLEKRNFKYRLYDLNGSLLRDKKVEDEETEISMQGLSPSVYFLKISVDNVDVKIFKIIKR